MKMAQDQCLGVVGSNSDPVTNRMFTKVLQPFHVRRYNNKDVLLNIK